MRNSQSFVNFPATLYRLCFTLLAWLFLAQGHAAASQKVECKKGLLGYYLKPIGGIFSGSKILERKYYCQNNNNTSCYAPHLSYWKVFVNSHHLPVDSSVMVALDVNSKHGNNTEYFKIEKYKTNNKVKTRCSVSDADTYNKAPPAQEPNQPASENHWCLTNDSNAGAKNGDGFIFGVTEDGLLYHNAPAKMMRYGTYNSYFDISTGAIALKGTTPKVFTSSTGIKYERYEHQLSSSDISMLDSGNLEVIYAVSHDHNVLPHSLCRMAFKLKRGEGYKYYDNANDSDSGDYNHGNENSSDVCLLGGQRGFELPPSENHCALSNSESDDVVAGRPHEWAITSEKRNTSQTQTQTQTTFWAYYTNKETEVDAPFPNNVNKHSIRIYTSNDVNDDNFFTVAHNKDNATKLLIPTFEDGNNATFFLNASTWGQLKLHLIPASSSALSLEEDPFYNNDDQLIEQATLSTDLITARPFGFIFEAKKRDITPFAQTEDPKALEYFTFAGAPFDLKIIPVSWQEEDADTENTALPRGHHHAQLTKDNCSIPDDLADLSDNPRLSGERTLPPSADIDVSAYDCNSSSPTLSFNPSDDLLNWASATDKAESHINHAGNIRFQASFARNSFLNNALGSSPAFLSHEIGPFIPYKIIASQPKLTFISNDLYRHQTKDEHKIWKAYRGEDFLFKTDIKLYGYQEDLPLNPLTTTVGLPSSESLRWKFDGSPLSSGFSNNPFEFSESSISVSETFNFPKSDKNTIAIEGSKLSMLGNNNFGTPIVLNATEVQQENLIPANVELYDACLHMPDRSGPEDSDLYGPIWIRYWSRDGWKKATFDSGTIINSSNLYFQTDEKKEWHNFVSNKKKRSIGIGHSKADYDPKPEKISWNQFNIPISGGENIQTFTAPGANQTGKFKIKIDTSESPWLQCRRDNNNQLITEEIANFEFGTYRGHDRVIYWQEVVR